MKKNLSSLFEKIAGSKPAPVEVFLTLLDQGIFSLGSFAASIIIGRFCAREELGLYLLGFTLLYLIMDIQGAFITTPYTIFFPRLSNGDKVRYTGSTLLHQTILAVGCAMIMIGVYLVLPEDLLPAGFPAVLLALALVLSFILLREYLRRIFFAQMRMKAALVLDSLVAVLQVFLLLSLVHLEILSAQTAILVVGCCCAAIAVFWLVRDRKQIVFEKSRVSSSLSQNFQFGKWIFASGILWNLSTYLYPWVLASIHGTDTTGIWAACLGIIALSNPLYIGLQNFVTPKMAHTYASLGREGLRRYTLKAVMVFGLVLGLSGLFLFSFGDMLLVFLYGEKFAGNAAVISLLAINLVLVSVGFPFSRALFIVERAEIDFRINFVSLAVLFTIGLWAIHDYGALGAAVGLTLGNGVALVFRTGAFQHLIK